MKPLQQRDLTLTHYPPIFAWWAEKTLWMMPKILSRVYQYHHDLLYNINV